MTEWDLHTSSSFNSLCVHTQAHTTRLAFAGELFFCFFSIFAFFCFFFSSSSACTLNSLCTTYWNCYYDYPLTAACCVRSRKCELTLARIVNGAGLIQLHFAYITLLLCTNERLGLGTARAIDTRFILCHVHIEVDVMIRVFVSLRANVRAVYRVRLHFVSAQMLLE